MFNCDGKERRNLEELIAALELEHEVVILGGLSREQLRERYAQADVVVLTSLSEGIPVTLMEAMAMERIVLAPAITGIPELVISGKTGFLYQPNSLQDFLQKLEFIRAGCRSLEPIGHAARRHVTIHFNSELTLPAFATDFLHHARAARHSGLKELPQPPYENPILQQVQLPLQRNRSLSA